VVSFVCKANEISDRLLNKIMRTYTYEVCKSTNDFKR